MTNFWQKIAGWFQARPAKKKLVSQPKPAKTQPAQAANYRPINHKHYRKLIGKIARQAIAEQRNRTRERRNL